MVRINSVRALVVIFYCIFRYNLRVCRQFTRGRSVKSIRETGGIILAGCLIRPCLQ